MFSADLGGYTAPLPAATDPPFQKVALLLHGDGTNGAQNNTFLDSSSNNFSITRTGNVAQGTFSPFSLAEGQWSNYFDGSGDKLSSSVSSVAFGTGAFTVEFWINTPVWVSWQALVTTRPDNGGYADAWHIGSDVTGNLLLYSNTFLLSSGANVLVKNQWNHVVLVRNGSSNTSFFVNGIRVATGTVSSNFTRTLLGIGGFPSSAAEPTTGYISNLRIVSGTAVYDPTQSTITVPISPLTAITNTSLLTCQSNRFKDNSSNNFTITRNGDTKVTAFSPFAPSAAYSASTNGGSAYFDGSGDYLSTPSSSDLSVGSGDFTIEGFIYPTAVNSTDSVIIDFRSGSFSNNGPTVSISNSSRNLYFAAAGSARITGSAVTLYEWSHFAVTRSGTSTKLFLNGVQVGSTYTDTNSYLSPARIWVGADDDGSPNAYYNGYTSNFRVIKGSAIYTANFTPPTAPLTAVANTSLLLNCTNAGIIDNAGKNDIETVGNAQVSTSVKKYGTGSISFGNVQGNYIRNQSSALFAYGTGDFTIEFWVYLTVTTSSAAILFDQRTSDPQTVPTISQASNAIYYYVNGAIRISGTLNTANTWIHIAVCRSSGSTKMFVNGTQVGSTYTDTNNYIASPVYCGCRWDANGPVPGYMDDIRVTKGQALYTANFTPPTQAFPNV